MNTFHNFICSFDSLMIKLLILVFNVLTIDVVLLESTFLEKRTDHPYQAFVRLILTNHLRHIKMLNRRLDDK